jgi:hypothetical protein
MGKAAHSERWLLMAFFLISCGEFDNSVIGVLDSDVGEPTACSRQPRVTIGAPIFPPLQVGRAWVGWLHIEGAAAGDVEWEVSGLPDGFWFNPEHTLVAGIPLLAGTYDVGVVARSKKCPELEDAQTYKLQIAPVCIDDCGPDVSCEESNPGVLRAYVSGVEPGSTFAGNGLIVESVNTLRSPDADTTHQMVLSNPESVNKEKIVIYYSLPGGVPLRLHGGAVVDLRYIRGAHDDHYLFLTVDQLTRFVAYIGHLSRDEIVQRCPRNDSFAYCRLPLIENVPMGCDEHVTCNGRQRLALDVPTVPKVEEPDGTGEYESLETSRLLPGQAGKLPNHTIIRVVDAWQGPVGDKCSPAYALPYFRSFYIVALDWKDSCSYSEIYPVFEDTGSGIPTVGVYESRVLFPLEYQSVVKFTWSRELPMKDVLVDVDVDQANRFWVDMPMAGDYRIYASQNVQLDNGTVMKPCAGPAARIVGVYPTADVRIEVVWSVPTTHGTGEPPVDLELVVGSESAMAGSVDKLKIIEMQTPLTAQSVVVTFPQVKGLNEVTTLIRIWLDGSLVHEQEDKLLPGDKWAVGVVGADVPGGFATQWSQ